MGENFRLFNEVLERPPRGVNIRDGVNLIQLLLFRSKNERFVMLFSTSTSAYLNEGTSILSKTLNALLKTKRNTKRSPLFVPHYTVLCIIVDFIGSTAPSQWPICSTAVSSFIIVFDDAKKYCSRIIIRLYIFCISILCFFLFNIKTFAVHSFRIYVMFVFEVCTDKNI